MTGELCALAVGWAVFWGDGLSEGQYAVRGEAEHGGRAGALLPGCWVYIHMRHVTGSRRVPLGSPERC